MTDQSPQPPPTTAHTLLDPAAAFGSPRDLLRDPALTRAQKIDLLHRWAYEAAERDVAVEEGMPNGEDDLQREVQLALKALHAEIDTDHSGPTKHHGMPD